MQPRPWLRLWLIYFSQERWIRLSRNSTVARVGVSDSEAKANGIINVKGCGGFGEGAATD
jgi:hypothetical protein